jgi:hypothetical protein
MRLAPSRRAAPLCLWLGLAAATSNAAVLPFEGTLSIVAPGFLTCLPAEEIPPGEVSCGWPMIFADDAAGMAEIALTPGGELVSLQLSGGLFHLTGTRYINDTVGALFPLYSMAAAGSNQAGTVGPAGGVLPLAGLFKVCMYAACTGGAVANLSVPLSVIGAGGAQAATPGAVSVTAFGAPWTTGTITVGEDPTQVHGSAGPGVLNLVTPISISTDIGAFATLDVGYARLVLHYVPEPTTAVLLGAGVLALAARARSLRR